MAVGVVSLATLFPASVLRSIQASQLTNSALLSKNAKARLKYDPSIIGNKIFLPTDGFDPASPPTTAIVDPFGMLPQYQLPDKVASVNSLPRYNGGMTRIDFAESLALLPDSWSLIRQDGITGGYLNDTFYVTVATSSANLAEISPRTLDGGVNAAGFLNPEYRVVLMDITGRYAIRRSIRQVLNGNQLSWSDPNGTSEPNLPNGFIPARCRIEVRDNRYTWILTVRKRPLSKPVSVSTPWEAQADLAVFFNRSFKTSDETAISMRDTSQMAAAYWGGFDQLPGVAGVDDNQNGTTDYTNTNGTNRPDTGEYGAPGSDDRRTLYAISLPSNLKKGSYILETRQARWYRVVNIDKTNNLILLDRDLFGLPQGGNATFVMMKGIVQVFELGTFP